MKNQTTVIGFDLNDTLIKWKEAFDASFMDSVGEWTARWSGEQGENAAVKALQRYHRLRRDWRRNHRANPAASKRTEWLKMALNEIDLPVNDETIESIMKDIVNQQSVHARMADGAEALLKRLSKRYKLVIISDMSLGKVENIVRHSGLDRFVPQSQWFARPPSGKRKPDPARFGAVNRKLNVSPGRCLMVGDSLTRDIGGAIKAGWDAVWLKPGNAKTASRRIISGKPVVRIGKLDELSQLLR